MTMKTFFPVTLDNTFMFSFAGCELKGFRNHLQHLSRSTQESTDLVAGGAFAAGLEVARKAYWNLEADPEEAMQEGRDALFEAYGDHDCTKPMKSPDRMAMALEMFFMEHPMDTDVVQPLLLADGSRAIEYSFAFELPFDHPDLPGEKLVYTGRADMLVEHAGRILVYDDKTTGAAFNKNWAAQWDMRSQFTGYCAGLQKAGIKAKGAYVRGIHLGKTAINFQDCMTVRNDWQTEIWEANLIKRVGRILEAYKAWKVSGESPAMYFDMNSAEACNAYFRPCSYMELCRTRNSERYLEAEYDQMIWLPHEQRRTELNEYLETLEGK